MKTFETKVLTSRPDYLAPDGSEIRLFPSVRGGGLAHCTLPPNSISLAVVHKTVDEIWYFIEGQGEVWRRLGKQEQTIIVRHGSCVTIPVGTHFQFRNTARVPLRFIIVTMPSWPGAQEATRVTGRW